MASLVQENRDVAYEGGLAAPQNHTDFVSGRIVIDGDERSVCSGRADLRCAGGQRHSVSGNQLREEKIPDVSLATFHIFDKESRTGKRLACGCGGGCCLFARAPSSGLGSDIYSPQPHRPTGRGHKHVPKY